MIDLVFMKQWSVLIFYNYSVLLSPCRYSHLSLTQDAIFHAPIVPESTFYSKTLG